MGFDMNIKKSDDFKMTKLDFKLTTNLLKKIEEICKRNFINQNNTQEYANFLEDFNEEFKENAPIIIDLIINNIDLIKTWVENQKNTTYDLSNLKSYGKYIKRMQLSLARPFSYSTLMASGVANGVVYFHIVRNDGQSFVLDLNHNEVLDFCGELFRIISHKIKPEDIDKKAVGPFLASNMKLLAQLTGESMDKLLEGKANGMDK